MWNLRDIPIKRKLTVILLTTLSAALLSAGVAIIVIDSYLFRDRMRRDFEGITRIVADINTAALAFDDPRAAQETLAALRARPHVVIACIFRENGTELARYTRDSGSIPCPPAAAQEGVQFDNESAIVRRAVTLRGQRLGSVVLLYDLTELADRRLLYGSMVLGVLLLASLFAFLLSSRMRAVVEAPIADLAETAITVAETGDYGVRARKLSGAELGLLTDAFNQMLARIQAGDYELRTAKEELEARVAERTSDLQRQTAELARSNADLQQFAYVASHDLQEPLRMVFSYMNLISEQYSGKLDAEADEFIGYAVDGARRMRQLITDLLEYSRLGSHNPELTPTDCGTIFKDVCANLNSTIVESAALVTSGELPVVLAEPSQITQLFQNLIANGIKFHSDAQPRVHISAERDGNWWKFSVADNGIGIDREHHERIFVIFQRLHDRMTYSGTGIGLAICNKIVNRLGGRIWVESEPGAGSRFYFTMPAVPRDTIR